MSQTHLRDFLVALSLANLLFLKAWIEIFEGWRHPYFRANPDLYWIDCAAVALNVLLVAGLFWLGAWLARRSGRAWALVLARGVFLMLFLLMFFSVWNVLRGRFPRLSLDSLAATVGRELLIVVGLGLLVLVVYWRTRLVTAAMLILLVLSPFALITFAQAAWFGMCHLTSGRVAGGAAGRQPGPREQSERRVRWLIFDEMDYRLSFPDRPDRLSLPAFDRLRSESLFATQAAPPAGYTGRSLPGLLTGRRVVQARPSGLDELVLTFGDNSPPAGWSTLPTVFSLARGAGYTTGVVGWYHPYCRLFSGSLTYCAWEPVSGAEASYPVVSSMLEFMRMATPPFLRGLFDRLGIKDPDLNVQYHIESYLRILNRAQKVIADGELDLVLIHMPVPHAPFIYDRHTAEFTLSADPREGYLDNLALADRGLGDLRRTLEEGGLWEGTTLLVSSDHPWRDSKQFDGKQDPRVPFLLKLPGQRKSLVYDRPFNSVLTKDLILAVLRGEVSTAQEAAEWLTRPGGAAHP